MCSATSPTGCDRRQLRNDSTIGLCGRPVSAVMNSCGNIGGALSTAVLGYLVQAYGWNVPFLVAAGFCAAGAALFLKIDATRRIKY